MGMNVFRPWMLLVAGVVMFLLAGCTSSGGVTLLNPGVVAGPPVFFGNVRVFASREIGREVEELGSVSIAINAEVPGTSLLWKLQREAARLGADAIVGFEQWGTTVTGVAVRYIKKNEAPKPSSPREPTTMNGIRSLTATLLVLTAVASSSQTLTTAVITGRVTGTDGDPIPGAHVVLLHVPTGVSYGATTRPDGHYVLPHLHTGGPYRLRVSHVGYALQTRDGLYLRMGENARWDVELREQAVQEDEIVVSARRGEILNESTTGASLSVSRRQMDDLPQSAATFEDAARLSPYISGGSALGRNDRYNDLHVDGASFTDQFGALRGRPTLAGIGVSPVNLDAVQEFQVDLAPFDVRQSGFTGTSITAVTRGGTKTVQGSMVAEAAPGWAAGRNPDDGRTDFNSFLDTRAGFQTGGPLGRERGVLLRRR